MKYEYNEEIQKPWVWIALGGIWLATILVVSEMRVEGYWQGLLKLSDTAKHMTVGIIPVPCSPVRAHQHDSPFQQLHGGTYSTTIGLRDSISVPPTALCNGRLKSIPLRITVSVDLVKGILYTDKGLQLAKLEARFSELLKILNVDFTLLVGLPPEVELVIMLPRVE